VDPKIESSARWGGWCAHYGALLLVPKSVTKLKDLILQNIKAMDDGGM
jgi:hypothetical protein